MLYSTREIIPQKALDYLSKIPEREEDKKQCVGDFLRTTVNVGFQKNINNVNQEKISREKKGVKKKTSLKKNSFKEIFSFKKVKTNKIESFEDAQAKVASAAREAFPNTSENDISYLSHLAVNLCNQGFMAAPTTILYYKELYDPAIVSIIPSSDPKCNLDDRTIDLQRDHLKLIWKPWFFYGTEDDPKVIQRTITWTFFPDKTMQLSMDNPIDRHEAVCKDYFKALVTRGAWGELVSIENIDRAQKNQERTDINDPLNELVMDCNWERCEIFSKLVEPNADLSQIDHQSISQKVEKIYQIENLSKANPYTIARLISTYMKKNPNVELKSEEAIYNMLSEEAKENLKKIVQELNKRLDNEGIFLKIRDIIDFVINFLLKLANYFNMKIDQSYLSTRDFNDFCENFKVENNESDTKTFQQFCGEFHSNFIFPPQNQV